jgi:hypothetical protein
MNVAEVADVTIPADEFVPGRCPAATWKRGRHGKATGDITNEVRKHATLVSIIMTQIPTLLFF